MKPLKIIFSSVTAAISGTLGTLGLLGLCCTVAVAGFFALFGISSTGFLMTYNKLFLAAAVFFLALAIIFYLKYRKENQNCKKCKFN